MVSEWLVNGKVITESTEKYALEYTVLDSNSLIFLFNSS
jgi:hypothetical protein